MLESNKKAQMFIEFLYYFSFLLFGLTLVYMVSSSRAYSFVRERRNLAAELISIKLKQETNYAVAFGDGYKRNFSLPPEVLDSDYSIEFENRRVRVEWRESSVRERIVTNRTQGKPGSGMNLIKNEDGKITFE